MSHAMATCHALDCLYGCCVSLQLYPLALTLHLNYMCFCITFMLLVLSLSRSCRCWSTIWGSISETHALRNASCWQHSCCQMQCCSVKSGKVLASIICLRHELCRWLSLVFSKSLHFNIGTWPARYDLAMSETLCRLQTCVEHSTVSILSFRRTTSNTRT